MRVILGLFGFGSVALSLFTASTTGPFVSEPSHRDCATLRQRRLSDTPLHTAIQRKTTLSYHDNLRATSGLQWRSRARSFGLLSSVRSGGYERYLGYLNTFTERICLYCFGDFLLGP